MLVSGSGSGYHFDIGIDQQHLVAFGTSTYNQRICLFDRQMVYVCRRQILYRADTFENTFDKRDITVDNYFHI